MARQRLTRMLVVLIVLATAAFAGGAAIERSEHHSDGTSEATTPGSESAAHRAAESEGSETGSETGTESGSEPATESHSESLLGLNPEALGLVLTAVITSVFLALAVWARPDQGLLLLLTGAAMLLFGALDIREVIHQADESNTGLAALAAAIAALHLTAAGLALSLAVSRSGPRQA